MLDFHTDVRYDSGVLELQNLEAAAADFDSNADDDLVDPGRLAGVIDRLQAKLSRVLFQGSHRGDHLLSGRTPVGWVAETCSLSPGAASERLRTGEQLEAMPRVAQALASGEIGYQPAAVICKLRHLLREDLRELVDEEYWIGEAKKHSVKDLNWLEQHVRYMLDPDSFDHGIEEDWEKRFLSISESGGMYHITGVLDRVGGAALEAAIESLSKRLGADDTRTPKQRRADAMVEVAHHAMDKGTLPRRHGVRPHIAVTTTVEGLKGELGASLSELPNGLPVSSKTVQRLACDGALHRVLKAESMVIDVGRARRTAQPAQWRGIAARHKTCAWTGCDRPLSWTQAHHVDFWEHGGQTNLRKMIPLCHYHHRLVHEGGWQVILAGARIEFVAPDRPVMVRRRWGESRWAA
jgi:uncharacterized protein DUF222